MRAGTAILILLLVAFAACQTSTCYGVESTDPAVCSRRGKCAAADNCVCNEKAVLGKTCGIHMAQVSSRFSDFNSTKSINKSVRVPGSKSLLNCLVTDKEAHVSSGSTLTGKRDICFDGTFSLADQQTFVSLTFPLNLPPSGVIVDVVLQPKDGSNAIYSSLEFTSQNQRLKIRAGANADVSGGWSTTTSLSVKTPYVMLISVNERADWITAQIIDKKNVTLVTAAAIITSGDVTTSLLETAYYVCMTMSNADGSRALPPPYLPVEEYTQAPNNQTLIDVQYYGTQNIGQMGTPLYRPINITRIETPTPSVGSLSSLTNYILAALLALLML